jgi:hypothetical protein
VTDHTDSPTPTHEVCMADLVLPDGRRSGAETVDLPRELLGDAPGAPDGRPRRVSVVVAALDSR